MSHPVRGVVAELRKNQGTGNVGALKSSMERTVSLAASYTNRPRPLTLTVHAPRQVEPPSPWATVDFTGTLAEVGRRAQAEVEKRKIEHALKDAGGDKGQASGVLQISYKMLLMKLKEYRIPE